MSRRKCQLRSRYQTGQKPPLAGSMLSGAVGPGQLGGQACPVSANAVLVTKLFPDFAPLSSGLTGQGEAISIFSNGLAFRFQF